MLFPKARMHGHQGSGEKLELPALYQLTDYHWLLVYEVLAQGLIPLNDWQVPEVNRELAPLAGADDGYLKVRRRGRRTPQVQIDFDGFIDQFFWDTDFLLATTVYEGLDPEGKQKLRNQPGTFRRHSGPGTPPRRVALGSLDGRGGRDLVQIGRVRVDKKESHS